MFTTKIKALHPLKNSVIVKDMHFGNRLTSTGLYIPDDNAKSRGIRSRWGKVYAIGPLQEDIEVGQWICIAHGRWTRGIEVEFSEGEKATLRRVDNNDILLVTDEQPDDDHLGDYD